jgi:hypothetical protein
MQKLVGIIKKARENTTSISIQESCLAEAKEIAKHNINGKHVVALMEQSLSQSKLLNKKIS